MHGSHCKAPSQHAHSQNFSAASIRSWSLAGPLHNLRVKILLIWGALLCKGSAIEHQSPTARSQDIPVQALTPTQGAA